MHLLFIQRQGMSVPPSVEKREKAGERIPQMPFFPHYVLHDVMWWYVALAVLAALALFSAVGAGHQGRRVRAGAGGHPARVVLPGDVPDAEAAARRTSWASRARCWACSASACAAVVLLLLPFLDRGAAEGRSSRLVTVGGIVALAYMVVFTIYGYLAA